MKNIAIAIISCAFISSAFAAGPVNYREPTSLPKNKTNAASGIIDEDFDNFKCARKNDSKIIITKKNVVNGIVKYEIQIPLSSDPVENGEFKEGKPSKKSNVEKMLDEYKGPIPGFVCAEPN